MGKLYDFIVYGATGFTGKLVCQYLHKVSTGSSNCKWAIAGRSQTKLAALKRELLELSPLNLPDLLIAEASDTISLVEIFSACEIVLNCTGPYRFFGRDIVKACIAGCCHYMDICGEPQFMESSFLEFHDAALEKKLLIIHACAFDSVPADLGTLFTMRQFSSNKCSSIESFLTIDCPEGLSAHYTTFECAVHGIGDAASLKSVRKDIAKKYQPPKIITVGPKLERSTSYYFENRLGKYAIPFMGADASVVRSTQRSMSLRDATSVLWPQYAAYVTIDNFYWVATTAVYGSIFSTLASFSVGRSLLLSCPELATNGVFSHNGPNEKQLKATTFEMKFFAVGYAADAADEEEDGDEDEYEVGKTERENECKEASLLSGSGDNNNNSSSSSIDAVSGVVQGEVLSSGEDAAVQAAWTTAPGPVDTKARDAATQRLQPNEASAGLSTDFSQERACSLYDIIGLGGGDNSNSSNQAAQAKCKAAEARTELNRRVTTSVTGPEPGYVATPVIFITLACCLLEERGAHMPQGGVLTPGAAFFSSPSVFDRLDAAGIKFTLVSVEEGELDNNSK